MANRNFHPMHFILQMEQDLIQEAESVIRAMQFQPRADMYETDDAMVIKMELAGAKPEHLSITLSPDDRVLTVTGERRELQDELQEPMRCHQLEIYYGTFERDILLPGNIRVERDQIRATYRSGLLVIKLPKRLETLPVTRSILIEVEEP